MNGYDAIRAMVEQFAMADHNRTMERERIIEDFMISGAMKGDLCQVVKFGRMNEITEPFPRGFIFPNSDWRLT